MAFQQAQQQTNETLAMAIGRPIKVAQQTKPPTLPPISSGPQGQQDIARFEVNMKTYGVIKSTWSTELRALLRGDLTNLAMSMPKEELGDYDAFKQQLYAHMGVSKQNNSTTGSIPRSNQHRLLHRWVIERRKQQEPAPKTAPPSKK